MNYVTYGVREFQANIGKALRAAEKGDQIIITSHNKAVAVLARIDVKLPGESPEERKLRRLAGEGRIRLGAPGVIKPFKAARVGGLSGQVIADRR